MKEKIVKFKKVKVLILLFIFIFSSIAFSQEEKKPKYGVGFQVSYPAWGISGIMDLTDKISAQVVIGLFGDLNSFIGRVNYKFTGEKFWNVYGYGEIGIWTYPYIEFELEGWVLEGKKKREIAPAFGAGAGVEYNWQALSSKLPPVWYRLEIGLGYANFDKADCTVSTLWWGVGLHFRF